MDIASLRECRHIAKEIKQLEELYVSILGPSGRTIDGMPRGGSTSDPVSSIVNQRVRLHEQLMTKRAELMEYIIEIEDYIQSISSSLDRQIMRDYYFYGYNLEEIGERVGYSERQVRRRRNMILEKMSCNVN